MSILEPEGFTYKIVESLNLSKNGNLDLFKATFNAMVSGKENNNNYTGRQIFFCCNIIYVIA